ITSARCNTNRTGRAIRHPCKFDGGCEIEKAMEKQESKNRFPTFPQPRLLRNTLSYGIRIQGAGPPCVPFLTAKQAHWPEGLRQTYTDFSPRLGFAFRPF